MTDVEFEQLLSYKWHDDNSIRDMIYFHIFNDIGHSERTKEQTKFFIDSMFEKFVNRKM